MKKLFTTILTISAFLSFAQAPQGINYQGVARNLNGILAQSNIAVKFDIHQGSAGGTVVFTETHNTTTNDYGLFTLVIGSINQTSFQTINWGTGIYFIETSINGNSLGAQQLMSVPYALYADKAGNVNTYTLVAGVNTATLMQNNITPVGTINFTTASAPSYSLAGSGTNTLSLFQDAILVNSIVIPGVTATPNTTVVSTNTTALVINNSSINNFSLNVPNYKLTNGANTNTIVLSNGLDSSKVVIPSSSSAPLTSVTYTNSNSNVIITPAGTNSFVVNAYSYTLASNSNSITIGNGAGGTSNTVTVPTYSLSQTSNSITLYQNGTSAGTATLATNTASTTTLLSSTNITVTGSAPNYTISSPSYSLAFPSYSTAILYNGSAYTATIASPPVSYASGVLTVGSSTAPIPALWQENGGVVSPVTLTNNISVGTITNTGGKFEIEHNSSSSAPIFHLKQTTNALNRIKLSNNTITGKYWEVGAQTALTASNSALSINHFDGSNYKSDLVIYEDGKVQVHNLNTALASFHVSDINNTNTNGIASEGFGQQGQLNLARSNYSGPLNAPTRTVVFGNEELGRINFAGFNGSIYGDGAKIYAKSATNFSAGNTGTDLIFATVPTGSISNIDRMKIWNDGTVEILNKLRIPYGTITAGSVLTSDGFGNASWQASAVSTLSGTANYFPIWNATGSALTATSSIYQHSSGNVGIGTTTPNGLLSIQNQTSNDAFYIQDYSNATSLKVIKQNGYTGVTAIFQNLGATNNSPVVQVISSGTGKAIDASITSSLNPTIFAKNSYQNTVAGDFDGGLKAYNSGTIASIYAYKSNAAIGSAAVFENQNTSNSLSTIYATTNSTSTLTSVAELSNTGSGSAINASSSSNLVATINAKNTNAISNAVAGYFDGGIISKANVNSSYAFQVQGNAGISDYLNVLGNGNVGIGVTSPGYKLSIFDNSAISSLWVKNSGTGAAIEATATGTNALILNDGHIKSTQLTAPTVSVTACTFTTVGLITSSGSRTDTKGSILLNFPSSNILSGGSIDIKITFNKSYSQSPVVVVSPVYLPLNYYIPNISATDFTVRFVNNGISTLTSITNFSFNYFVVE